MSDVFKIINATKEEACRAAEAEAIRAKTGETESLSYDFANGKGFADAIESISGGSIDVKSAARCEIVTVGANTVSNPVDAIGYFGQESPYKGFIIVLLDTPTIQNQLGAVMCKPSATAPYWWRWRDSSLNWPSSFNNTWDTRLVEDSKYLVLEW